MAEQSPPPETPRRVSSDDKPGRNREEAPQRGRQTEEARETLAGKRARAQPERCPLKPETEDIG